MPTDIVQIASSVEAAKVAVANWGDVAIVGFDSGGTADDNTVYTVQTLTEVGTLFGITSDIYAAATDLFAQGLGEASFIRASQASKVDTSSSSNYVETTYTPLTGSLSVTADGSPITPTCDVTATIASVVPSGQVWVNPLTNVVVANSGVSTVVASYDYAEWSGLGDKLAQTDVDIISLADLELTECGAGDFDEMLTLCDANKWILTAAMGKAAPTATVTKIAAKFNSKNLFPVAHKSDQDVGAAAAGVISQVEPWDKLLYKAPASVTTDLYTNSEVDSILEPAKVNVLIDIGGSVVFSNGLALDGTDYKYIDITRTVYAVENEIDTRITNLIASMHVPYTEAGLSMIEDVIASGAQKYVDLGALVNYVIQMPDFATIPAADKANRILNNVVVTMYLAGHIQEVSISMSFVV
jgi:hypothetical protein